MNNNNNNNIERESDRPSWRGGRTTPLSVRGSGGGGNRRGVGARRDTTTHTYRQPPPPLMRTTSNVYEYVQPKERNYTAVTNNNNNSRRNYTNFDDSYRSRPPPSQHQHLQLDNHHHPPPLHHHHHHQQQQQYCHTAFPVAPPPVPYNFLYSDDIPSIDSGVSALQKMCIGSGPISFKFDNHHRQSNVDNRLFRDNGLQSQWKVGQRCFAPWSDARFYMATVLSHGPADMCTIRYDDYGHTSSVPQGMLIAPQMSSIHE